MASLDMSNMQTDMSLGADPDENDMKQTNASNEPPDINAGAMIDTDQLEETQKLQLAERANEIYRQQLKYMQDHLASLRSLIQDKENIIENLMLRYDLGIITQDSNRQGGNLPADEIELEELCRKAEALAQRTILENFELREMVNELRDENFHLRNEIFELQDKVNRQELEIGKLEKNQAAISEEAQQKPPAKHVRKESVKPPDIFDQNVSDSSSDSDAYMDDEAKAKRAARADKSRKESIAAPDFFGTHDSGSDEALSDLSGKDDGGADGANMDEDGQNKTHHRRESSIATPNIFHENYDPEKAAREKAKKNSPTAIEKRLKRKAKRMGQAAVKHVKSHRRKESLAEKLLLQSSRNVMAKARQAKHVRKESVKPPDLFDQNDTDSDSEAYTPGHSQQDWARSSFFNGDDNTENFLDDISAPENSDDDTSDASSTHTPTANANTNTDQDATFFNPSASDDPNPTTTVAPSTTTTTLTAPPDDPVTSNPIMAELVRIMIARFEHLVDRGFLNPDFLTRIRNDPQEILRFIRQNRAVVGDQLNRRLDPSMRPTPAKLEEQGIVPKGYFTNGPGAHDRAMTRKHRRKSTAQQDLAHLIALRPDPEHLVNKGLVERSTLQQHIELDANKIEEEPIPQLTYSVPISVPVALNDDDDMKTYEAADDDSGEHKGDESKQIETQTQTQTANTVNANTETQKTWEISILSSLLFKTISSALRQSCLDTQRQESVVLLQMEEMNVEMKQLRDALDEYFLNDEPDVLRFQAEEESIRARFHGIQKRLLEISRKQNAIHEKLRILHAVERQMIALQNDYDKNLGALRRQEEDVLKDLQEQRLRRAKAVLIRAAEKSQSHWALAKLDYTIQQFSDDVESVEFAEKLDGFLRRLRQVSDSQNDIVRDFDDAIERLESHLTAIRHEKSKVRHACFAQIYELHKQVEIAESLELGNRRLSVASATEIDRERRHHTVKIRRQLATLTEQLGMFNYRLHAKQLREIMDVQRVMSDAAQKAFFSVFAQTMSAVMFDVEVAYAQQEGVGGGGGGQGVARVVQELYGVECVLERIEVDGMALDAKVRRVMRFMQIAKNAMAYELHREVMMGGMALKGGGVGVPASWRQIKVETHRLNSIVVVMARKLSIHENLLQELDRISDRRHIPRLAEMRVKNVFERILKVKDLNALFRGRSPRSAMDVASGMLRHCFGIESSDRLQINGDYL